MIPSDTLLLRGLSLTGKAFVAAALVGLHTSVASAAAVEPVDDSVNFEEHITPLLQKYCYECHGNGTAKAGLALDEYIGVEDILSDRHTWEEVINNVRTFIMPPEGESIMPTQEERELLTGWLDKELFKFDPDNPDPGRVTIRRLNRAEYTNTIRDLVGVEFQATEDFPVDDSGYGFDTIGDVLSLPPMLMERYLAAAETILNQAIPTEPVESKIERHPGSLLTVGFNAIGDRGDGWIHLISLEEDDVALEMPVLAAGDYIVRVHAFSTEHGGTVVGQGSEKPLPPPDSYIPTQVAIAINDTYVQRFDTTTDENNPGVYEARIGLDAGKQRIRAVNARVRSKENDLTMLNGRLGKQQPGKLFVKWMEIEGPLHAASHHYAATEMEASGTGSYNESGERVMKGNGELGLDINVASENEHIIRVHAYANLAGDEHARMEVRVDGELIDSIEVTAPGRWTAIPGQRVFSPALLVPQPAVYEVRTNIAPGTRRLTVAFVNDFQDPENENPNWRDRDLIVRKVEVVNTGEAVVEPPMPAPIRELFAQHAPAEESLQVSLNTGDSAADNDFTRATAIVSEFATKAWRRPVKSEEVERLMSLYRLADSNGDSFEGSVKLALKAVLVSPHFLFRGELQPEPNNPAVVHEINEYALASRLSYFLWSSLPDDELFELASRGELRANLEAQVKRMLASPKAQAMVDNFAGQWLQVRSLEGVQPDRVKFPTFDPMLAAAMQKETEMFFEYIMREDRSIMEFLNADYTFVNGRLAEHYGIEGVLGEEFQKVSLEGTPRRGVITHGSVLTLTSNPTRTSPVKRGLWVLENLLNSHPPPAPPNVPALEQEGQELTGTLREQMEQHRADPNCASCHARMDPIGFGLENFDAVGAFRAEESSAPIDPSGRLTTGEQFAGASDLAEVLATSKRNDFVQAMADRMLTYALGRGMEYYDRPAIQEIAQGVTEGDFRFSRLVLEVVESLPFQKRRGEGDRASALASN